MYERLHQAPERTAGCDLVHAETRASHPQNAAKWVKCRLRASLSALVAQPYKALSPLVPGVRLWLQGPALSV